jgi:UDP-N-acetylmuramoylalanine--D-glutamate ligase
MKMDELKGKKVTVMGLGLHGGGVGTVKFLSSLGARVVVTDMKSEKELAKSLAELVDLENVVFVLGKHRPEDFLETEMVIKNPAVSWDNQYVKLALEKNIPVEMDSSLFFHLCKNKIIGVTGTKGKTTTASLISAILETAEKEVVKVGVSQVSVLDKLRNLKTDALVVFELSSWRLSALGRAKISPWISVITNFYPDHLNYYGSMEKYIADKENIFLFQNKADFCVINIDNALVEKSRGKIPSQIVEFSQTEIFSPNGAFVRGDKFFLKKEGREEAVLDFSEVSLRGEHNRANILAAITVSGLMNIKREDIRKGIMDFPGIPHRLELVGKFSGVAYYNDSAATTPESAISGIQSFPETLVLICGGANKNLDVSGLVEEIARNKNIKSMVFLAGESTERIVEELQKRTGKERTDFTVVNSMAEAVGFAKEVARDGDVVLLSPGAASFGIFKNEFDRGDQFRELVKSFRG